MYYIGIDLSGPSNTKDTVLVCFERKGEALGYHTHIQPAGDEEILAFIEEKSEHAEVVIGMDAPLSYEDGGGERKQDKELKRFIISLGMKPGSIMAPTMTKMVYLTLRGIRLSREITTAETAYPVHLVEVHPGAVIGSRMGTSLSEVLEYKKDLQIRSKLLRWFQSQQLIGIPESFAQESHTVDACAAALGAWHWIDPAYHSPWLYPAEPPLHPYDYCI
ncbi:DUF429 domain-containing protein [Halobacillus sp. ACCC02827]|uniref:DUF429 domain-containing protein n=1 Tax=unclassified Halobacillus TaxID=2636472 RepID=UPI0002A4FEFB|nr:MULTISPECIES: DUF429 domain-containing protein [unclassified Halobacillus]ELK44936.1 hypothetical protein D479_17254 [Halobacillus sp. BAB-2008]WJE14261.1 DUF429 domain-containing protein [Halobacillus sp. ACCC02827]